MEFGDLLKTLRSNVGWNCAKVGEASGVSPQTVGRLEKGIGRGRKTSQIAVLRVLADEHLRRGKSIDDELLKQMAIHGYRIPEKSYDVQLRAAEFFALLQLVSRACRDFGRIGHQISRELRLAYTDLTSPGSPSDDKIEGALDQVEEYADKLQNSIDTWENRIEAEMEKLKKPLVQASGAQRMNRTEILAAILSMMPDEHTEKSQGEAAAPASAAPPAKSTP